MDKQTNDIVKRIQSRVKAATGAERSIPMDICRKAYLDIVSDPPSPTEEEIRQVTQALINGIVVEVETTSIEPITSSEPTVTPEESAAAFQLAQPDEEETEAIAPETEEGQSEPNTLSLAQEPENATPSAPKAYSSSGIVPQPSPGESGTIPHTQVQQMVSQAFANQPQDFKDQITEYALHHSFDNARQVQEFLEQLRGIEFDMLVNILNDHFNRRGSMLNLLKVVLDQQKQKDGESSQNFFSNFNSQLLDFQREMQSRLSKTGL